MSYSSGSSSSSSSTTPSSTPAASTPAATTPAASTPTATTPSSYIPIATTVSTTETSSFVINSNEVKSFGNLISNTKTYSNTYEPTGNIYTTLTEKLQQKITDTKYDSFLYGSLKPNKWNTFATNIEGLTLTEHLNRLSKDKGTGSYGSMNKNITAYYLKYNYFSLDRKNNWEQLISTQIVPTLKSIWVFILPIKLKEY